MILVTGAEGQLGLAFRRRLGADARYSGRSDLDLGDLNTLRITLDELQPDLIINCAAYTAVDAAEIEEELAVRVNGHAVGVLARWCEQNDARLVTFSSDHVFDGRKGEPYFESDLPRPINAYGRSKLKGEELALRLGSSALVIRTSWLMSSHPPNFLTTVLSRARTGSISVVADQFGNPTFADDLVDATLKSIQVGASGVLHLMGSESASWFDLAATAAELANLPAGIVTACGTGEYPATAERPADSRMDSERRQPLGISALPAWRDVLPSVVERVVA